MKTFARTFLCFVLFSTGCSVVNLLETDADYERNHFAAEVKEGIDSAIQKELRKEKPSGQSEPYSEQLWARFWRQRIEHLKTKGFSDLKHYRGPTGDWFANYIIAERRRLGLPELNAEEPNQ
jgi:hypothetical protein